MLVDRMIKAAMLDKSLYEEVERDTTATTQALMVVIIVSLASGIGGAVRAIFAGHPGLAVSGLIGGLIMAIIMWAVWSLVVYFVGTSVFGGTATPGEVLRVVGFAYTPNTLSIVSFIPILGGLIALIASIWTLVAGVVAVRQALDVDTTKAILTIIIAAIVVFVVMAILGVVFAAIGLGFLAVLR